MAYKYSQTEKDNLAWFRRDDSKATLLSINLTKGQIRGLSPFKIEFTYPIAAIAGKNGSGKTTILALAACAYHNREDGFKLPWRKYAYYTFSDFFIQTQEEVHPEGINIRYLILHNAWRPTPQLPDGKGPGWQRRWKNKGGKWNDYELRVKRGVIYFGIERVVPHSEKSVSKSYRNIFRKAESQGWEPQVKEIVGRILNKDYNEFWYKKYSKYRLPLVETEDELYSGFNMGAGENALFEIFSTIFACDHGVLLVIDEIELGLHEEAQIRFIKELTIICKERHIQIVCTTHSYTILHTLPPEARFYIECHKNSTIVTPGISAAFAAGKLAGENSNELDIFVEDSIAKCLIENAIDNDVRLRINIIPIGSAEAVIRQLAARFKNIKKGDCIAVLDGDKAAEIGSLSDNFLGYLEKVDDKDIAKVWLLERVTFLPGSEWPEKWILTAIKTADRHDLSDKLSLNVEKLDTYIDEALRAGKHNEFFSLHKRTQLDHTDLTKTFARYAVKANNESCDPIRKIISSHLE